MFLVQHHPMQCRRTCNPTDIGISSSDPLLGAKRQLDEEPNLLSEDHTACSSCGNEHRLVKRRKILKRKKAVQFSDTMLVYNYKYVSSSEETNSAMNEEISTWYDQQDFKRIMIDNLKDVNAAKECSRDGVSLNTGEHCLRGLEILVSKDLQQAKVKTVALTVGSILDYQRVQRLKGANAEETLRQISIVLSDKALRYAIDLAAADAASAK